MLENLLAAERPGSTPGPAEVGSPELWEGLTVLDLYAGTGALGIEALSRGAARCDFVEANPAARRTIERNLAATGFTKRAKLIGADVERVIRGSAREALKVPYGVVLMDPPYASPDLGEALSGLATNEFLLDGALVAAEHSRRSSLEPEYGPAGRSLVEVRERRHGDTVISIYRFGMGDGKDNGDDDDGDLSGEL